MKYTLAIFGVALVLMPASALSGSEAGGQVNAQSPAVSYSKHCVTCHGRDGQSKTRKAKLNHARNLTDSKWQDRVSDERIFNSIMNGKGKMPGYSKKLSEQQIDALVPFVRAFRR